MPIYEYQCQACGHHLETLQTVHEEPLHTCPECGKAALKKQVSITSFKLEGTGWYATDFKNKGTATHGSATTKPAETQASTPESAGKQETGAADAKTV